MTNSMQTLHDALFAITATIGIAVALSIAFLAAGAFFERSKARETSRATAAPAQHPTQTDDSRELVLR